MSDLVFWVLLFLCSLIGYITLGTIYELAARTIMAWHCRRDETSRLKRRMQRLFDDSKYKLCGASSAFTAVVGALIVTGERYGEPPSSMGKWVFAVSFAYGASCFWTFWLDCRDIRRRGW